MTRSVHGCGRGKVSFFPAPGTSLIRYTDNGLFTILIRLKRQTVNPCPNHFAPLDKPTYRFMDQLINLSVPPQPLRRIGRASCRERVCKYLVSSWVAEV